MPITRNSSFQSSVSSGLECDFLTSENPKLKLDMLFNRKLLGVVNYSDAFSSPSIEKKYPTLDIWMAKNKNDSFAEIWTTSKAAEVGTYKSLKYAHDGEYIFCCGEIPITGKVSEHTKEAYVSAFELVVSLGYPSIFRMWNFIPRINDKNLEGLENYQDFCRGRAAGFDMYLHRIEMPAATGIGSRGGNIAFYFLACCKGKSFHIENPRQTPAYNYPTQYGPRSPSFARATYVESHSSRLAKVFVAGTASIIGHETVHKGDIERQCETALENIKYLISGENLADWGIDDTFLLEDLNLIKVYIRHDQDMLYLKKKFEKTFMKGTKIVYLNVDMCRSDLLVEIEGIAIKNSSSA